MMNIRVLSFVGLLAGVFVANAGLAADDWLARHGLTNEAYVNFFRESTSSGHRPIVVTGYRMADEVRYAAIFSKRPGVWQAKHGQSDQQFTATFHELTGQGYRPILVSGISTTKNAQYASIFEKNKDALAWDSRHRLTSQQFNAKVTELAEKGYRPIHATGYREDGNELYTLIMEQREGPAWRLRHGLTEAQFLSAYEELQSLGFVQLLFMATKGTRSRST